MGTVRVIGGNYRGKTIPVSLKAHDIIDITPQKVKGAVFSTMGEDMHGRSFLDLFAGSGQMGIEALSRGASPVIFSESDRRRCKRIQSFIDNNCPGAEAMVLNFPARRTLRYLSNRNISVDCLFCDPPYVREKGVVQKYDRIIEEAESYGTVRDSGMIIVQFFSTNVLRTEIGSWIMRDLKKYGTTSVAYYRHMDREQEEGD